MALRITLGLVGDLQVVGREKRGVWKMGLVEKNGFESEVGGANAIFRIYAWVEMVLLCWDVLKGKGEGVAEWGGLERGLWKSPPRWRRKQRRLCAVCGPRWWLLLEAWTWSWSWSWSIGEREVWGETGEWSMLGE